MEAKVCTTGSKRPHIEGDIHDESAKKRCLTHVQAIQSPKEAVEAGDRHPQQHSLLSLPPELLEAILKNFTNVEVANLRGVCSQFNEICQNILNNNFAHFRTTIQKHFHAIKGQMPRRESARRKHPLARKCDIIETLHMRLVLMQMTFGKHIERKHCCFFAGEILDEILRIMVYVYMNSMLARAYKVTDELFDLSTMAMEYFKERIEPGLPEVTYLSSDFLVPKCGNSGSLSPFSSPQGSPLAPQSPTSPTITSCSDSSSPHPAHTTVCSQTSRIRRNVGILCRCLRKVNTDLAVIKKEMRIYKTKLSHQSKQLMEYNSRLEQHDRKFDEQAKKMETLVKELGRCRARVTSSSRVEQVLPGPAASQLCAQVGVNEAQQARPQVSSETIYVPCHEDSAKGRKGQ